MKKHTKSLIILFLLLLTYLNGLSQGWSDPVTIYSSDKRMEYPNFCIDTLTGVLHCVWSYDFGFNPSYGELAYSHSFTDGELDFTEPVLLPKGPFIGASLEPSITTDSKSNVHLVYTDYIGENHTQILYSKLDATNQWRVPISISFTDKWEEVLPFVVCDFNDKIHVVWYSGVYDFSCYRSLEDGVWDSILTPYVNSNWKLFFVNPLVSKNNDLYFKAYYNSLPYGRTYLGFIKKEGDYWSDINVINDSNQTIIFPIFSTMKMDKLNQPLYVWYTIDKEDTIVTTHFSKYNKELNQWYDDIIKELPIYIYNTYDPSVAFDKYEQPHIVQTEYLDSIYYQIHYQYINNKWVGEILNISEPEAKSKTIDNKLFSYNGKLYLLYWYTKKIGKNVNKVLEIRTLDEVLTGVSDIEYYVSEFSVYPNPTESYACITYNLKRSSDLSIVIYDISGNIVQHWDILDNSLGRHTIEWDLNNLSGSKVSQGVYVVSIRQGSHFINKKIIVN